MNKKDREKLTEFSKKIDTVDEKINSLTEKITETNNKLDEMDEKLPGLLESYIRSAFIAIIVAVIFVPMIFGLIQSSEIDNLYFIIESEEDGLITNEYIHLIYNFSVLNYNSNAIKKDVTLNMIFNFENENISVSYYKSNIQTKERVITDNTIKFVWDYIPNNEGTMPGRFYLVFEVYRYPKTGGTITLTPGCGVSPLITVTLEDYGNVNVLKPTGTLWDW